ncbi:MAG: hypothetical protein JNL74_17050 [Fibrobacteres bacterium]|nr:hypothetical protein [Fibrobacterota bacterium]
MSFRSLSAQKMFEKMALEFKPEFAFKGKTPAQFKSWKKSALPKVLATLGDSIKAVPLNPMKLVEWEHDGLHKEKWLIDVQKDLSATFIIAFPKGLKRNEKRAAILCAHGHGAFGKEPVMGNDAYAEIRDDIKKYNYDYGHRMAKSGFITYAIDWIGFGERHDTRKPNHNAQIPIDKDWCNFYYLHATLMGTTPLAINIHHGMAATDFACTFANVDSKRLGIMGLSGGGVMALWLTLADKRIKATEIICYSDLFAHFGVRDLNYCGMQITPGLFKLVDVPDLQGLIAPQPLLIDLGANDACFKIDSAKACYNKLEKIYAAAGVKEKLSLDLHAGPHAWGGNKSLDFFDKYLKS